MANGAYGTIRIADPNIDDIEVVYTYIADRSIINTNNLKAIKLDAKSVLSPIIHPEKDDILGGLYNLRLPTSTFNQKGVYNIVIKPKEIKAKIVDCGVLSVRPDIKGLILDTTDSLLSKFSSKLVNNGLTGYRIEYVDVTSGKKTPNLFRIVTSANRCEPITENLTNSNQKSIRYRFNDASNLLFLTLTPSAASNIKPTVTPFIGNVGQEIIIYNTFFDPIMLEVEMVEHTIETIAHGIYGNQSESADGKFTIYTSNDKKEIYKQYNLFDIVDDFGKPLFKVKEEVTTIDSNMEFNKIINKIKNG